MPLRAVQVHDGDKPLNIDHEGDRTPEPPARPWFPAGQLRQTRSSVGTELAGEELEMRPAFMSRRQHGSTPCVSDGLGAGLEQEGGT
jgi:hypothetical protein